MTRTDIVIVFLLSACNGLGGGQQGAVGQQGPQGEAGPKGDPGAPGSTGASGTCDSNSCPPSTSVNGLSGGTLSSALEVPSLSVSSTITVDSGSTPNAARGVIVGRGGRQTSIGGFYCGKTSFDTAGDLGNSAEAPGVFGSLRMSKKHCEAACGNPAAHACLSTEILQSIMLGGGHSLNTDTNLTVKMPPDGTTGWVLAPDGYSSCADWTGTNTRDGLAYSLTANEGGLTRLPCGEPHPLLCCL